MKRSPEKAAKGPGFDGLSPDAFVAIPDMYPRERESQIRAFVPIADSYKVIVRVRGAGSDSELARLYYEKKSER